MYSEYAVPQQPVEDISSSSLEYTPVCVAPMVYSTPEVTTPKKNGKYGIIILVAALLAIVVAGGIILELL